MLPFDYAEPESLDDLTRLLDAHGPDAKILAGGTDLMVRLRSGRTLPRVVIDLKGVRELGSGITETGSCLRIGARAVMADLLSDARIGRWLPALVEAAAVVGSPQIRNRATLVGNISNASPAADTAPALLVYDSVANLAGLDRRRRVLRPADSPRLPADT